MKREEEAIAPKMFSPNRAENVYDGNTILILLTKTAKDADKFLVLGRMRRKVGSALLTNEMEKDEV